MVVEPPVTGGYRWVTRQYSDDVGVAGKEKGGG